MYIGTQTKLLFHHLYREYDHLIIEEKYKNSVGLKTPEERSDGLEKHKEGIMSEHIWSTGTSLSGWKMVYLFCRRR